MRSRAVTEDDSIIDIAAKIWIDPKPSGALVADPFKAAQPPVVRVADHPIAECNGMYRVKGYHDGRWFRYESDMGRHLYHYTPLQGQWQIAGPAPPANADPGTLAQYVAAGGASGQWYLNDAFEPESHLSDSSIVAVGGIPLGRHIWRYAQDGRWRQSTVRTTAVDQWQVLKKIDCRSGKDSGSRKLGEFWKDDILDVIGDPVVNRDGMSMLQILSKPRKSDAGYDTVRGGWVPIAPKGSGGGGKKSKKFVRKLGDDDDSDDE